MWGTGYRKFGNLRGMKEEIDPKAFGRRVRERRQELKWGQAKLGDECGYSQTNIGWIEQGKSKDPRKQVLKLAEALQTTPDWLLYEKGQKEAGPRMLTAEQFKQIYDALPGEIKKLLSAMVEEHMASGESQHPARKAK